MSVLDAFKTRKWSDYVSHVETVQVDEASQFPLYALISLVAQFPASRYAFIGDRRQLPAYADQGLPEDLHKYAIGNLMDTAARRNAIPRIALTLVFRCPPQITRICSDVFYDGELQSARDPQQRIEAAVNVRTSHTVSGTSLINKEEAELALRMGRRIQQATGTRSIGILCFYKAQAGLLATPITDEPFFVGTVDGSQGQEYDVVIILTTRNTDLRTSPFLADRPRVNVALSRTKAYALVLGNAEERYARSPGVHSSVKRFAASSLPVAYARPPHSISPLPV